MAIRCSSNGDHCWFNGVQVLIKWRSYVDIMAIRKCSVSFMPYVTPSHVIISNYIQFSCNVDQVLIVSMNCTPVYSFTPIWYQNTAIGWIFFARSVFNLTDFSVLYLKRKINISDYIYNLLFWSWDYDFWVMIEWIYCTVTFVHTVHPYL